MYFSIINELRFIDRESGLYNKGYLTYLFDLAGAGKNNTRSVLVLNSEGSLSATFDILYDVLNPYGDVIRKAFAGTQRRP